MSGLRSRGLCLTAVFAGLVAVGAARAQSSDSRDLLDEVRRRAQVAAQKVENDVRDALREAQQLTPAEAADRLRQALADLDADTALTAERRESLRRTLRDRLRQAEAQAALATTRPTTTRPLTRRVAEERREAEQARVAREITAARSLYRDGKTDEATRAANETAQRNAGNPAALASRQVHSVNDQLAAARRLQETRDRGVGGTMRDVERSAVLPSGDMDFPRDWKDRTKGRSNAVPLTPKEQELVRALNTPVTVSYKGTRFEDVIDHLQTLTNQPILVDRGAMDEAQVTYDTPVSVQVKGVAFRTLLRKVLGEVGLTYVIKDETLYVTSAIKARDMMVVRSYYVGDLATSLNPWGNWSPAPYLPTLNQLQTGQNMAQLIELIQSSVDPASWKVNGGHGTIAYNPATMSLVIKQSAEVHALIGGGLLR